MTSGGNELLLMEYHEVNAHLRANTTQFVSWFSFFLTFSLMAAAVFLVADEHRPGLRGVALEYGVPIVLLLLHILAFAGIMTFRRYMTAADCKIQEIVGQMGETSPSPLPTRLAIQEIVEQMGETSRSPLPKRFAYFMTDLMAAGFVISYFTWFFLLFVRV